VSRPRTPHDRVWVRRTARKLLRAPFTRETGRQVEYAALGLLLAIPGFVFVLVAFTRTSITLSRLDPEIEGLLAAPAEIAIRTF
jgi:hypothetical protein